MNNTERRIAIEAFNAGYIDAMNALIDTDDYGFDESEANEGIGMTLGRAGSYGAGYLIGVNSGICSAIYEAIHNASKKKSTVASVSALTAMGIPENKARQQFSKTAKFFKSKGYLSDDFDESRNVIMYSDLTSSGEEFMDGYYTKMDSITEFSIEKAIKAKKPNDSNSANIGYILHLISAIANIALIPLTFGFTIIGTIISVVLVKHFKKEKAKVEKFERTSIKESASIFDDDFFMV